MKHGFLKYLLTLFVLFVSIEVFADDYSLIANDIKAQRGSSSQLNVFMSNDETISALQFDVFLPIGVEIEESRLGTRASQSHSMTVKMISESIYRVLVSSSNNSSFKENVDKNNESIVSLSLNIPIGYSCGKHNITMNNITLSHYDPKDRSSKPFYPSNCSAQLEVMPADSFLISY